MPIYTAEQLTQLQQQAYARMGIARKRLNTAGLLVGVGGNLLVTLVRYVG